MQNLFVAIGTAQWSLETKKRLKELDPVYRTRERRNDFVRGIYFVAGTPVHMADGTLRLTEQTKQDDLVVSQSDASPGLIAPSKVLSTRRLNSTHIRRLLLRVQQHVRTPRRASDRSGWKSSLSDTSDGGSDEDADDREGDEEELISTTDEHPFWVDDQGWVEAGSIEPGMPVLLRGAKAARCMGSWREEHPEGVWVYNLEVKSTRTFFVGKVGARVHNFCEEFERFKSQLPDNLKPQAEKMWREMLAPVDSNNNPLIKFDRMGPELFRENAKHLFKIADPDFNALLDHAHHMFPKDFEKRFAELGIYIHNPRYGSFWFSEEHLQLAKEYNKKWRLGYFDNFSMPKTKETALQFARELAEEFDLDILF